MTDRDGLRDIRVPLRYAPTLELPPARPANVFDVLAEGYAAACTGLVAGAQAMSLDAQRRAVDAARRLEEAKQEAFETGLQTERLRYRAANFGQTLEMEERRIAADLRRETFDAEYDEAWRRRLRALPPADAAREAREEAEVEAILAQREAHRQRGRLARSTDAAQIGGLMDGEALSPYASPDHLQGVALQAFARLSSLPPDLALGERERWGKDLRLRFSEYDAADIEARYEELRRLAG